MERAEHIIMGREDRRLEKREEKENIRGFNKLASILQLPTSVIAGVTHMEVNGNHEAVLEGCGGIIEYTDEVVRVKTGKIVTRFSGRDLKIKCIQVDSLVVQGFITAIEFLL